MAAARDQRLQQGINASKLVLGLVSYGRTSQLTTAQQHNVGDTYTRLLGSPGRLTKDSGTLAYYEVRFNPSSPQPARLRLRSHEELSS